MGGGGCLLYINDRITILDSLVYTNESESLQAVVTLLDLSGESFVVGTIYNSNGDINELIKILDYIGNMFPKNIPHIYFFLR
jgi:hypothetical protein